MRKVYRKLLPQTKFLLQGGCALRILLLEIFHMRLAASDHSQKASA